ncbi:hypothetical protein H6504_05825 [Candidatus Woesearchaeota archaeon]|nr:hypothetical protein [Candidatus Woesearchaeota archaeon]
MIYKIAKLKHDRYIEDLCSKIEQEYDVLYTNVPVFSKRNKRRRVAEIDVLAVKENKYDVYEVKCSYRITKAKKQLKRIKRLLPRVTNSFFFCGESSSLEMVL